MSRKGVIIFSIIMSQMIRVISSPFISTTGVLTLIFDIRCYSFVVLVVSSIASAAVLALGVSVGAVFGGGFSVKASAAVRTSFLFSAVISGAAALSAASVFLWAL